MDGTLGFCGSFVWEQYDPLRNWAGMGVCNQQQRGVSSIRAKLQIEPVHHWQLNWYNGIASPWYHFRVTRCLDRCSVPNKSPCLCPCQPPEGVIITRLLRGRSDLANHNLLESTDIIERTSLLQVQTTITGRLSTGAFRFGDTRAQYRPAVGIL